MRRSTNKFARFALKHLCRSNGPKESLQRERWNGERLETYIIKGKKGSGEVTLNGPAARKVQKGDKVIIISYARMSLSDAKMFNPALIFPNNDNILM